MNGAIGEAQGYNNALQSGEVGIAAPGKVTANGPDYITFNAETGGITIWDAKYSSSGYWPSSAKNFGSQSWLDFTQNAINLLDDLNLQKIVQEAFDSGNIDWQIFKWPQ